MQINLGYVSLSLTLEDTSYNKTITYSSYLKLEPTKANKKLTQIIKNNLHNLKIILKYNHQNKVNFFRLSHNIIPLATHPQVQYDYITPFQKEWTAIGNLITKYHTRVDTHSDQFCVLNSISPQIVKISKGILEYNYQIFKAMNIQSKCVVHIGGATISKEEGLKRFKETFTSLPKYLQDIIIIENDDKIYNTKDTLELCEELNVPMVLDYHHHLCNQTEEKIQSYLPRIIHTWDNTNLPPKMHFSSPKSKKERRSHSNYINYQDFITFLDIISTLHSDIDIMLECKAKDLALFRLLRQLNIYSHYKIKNTTIIIKEKNS